jgi:hypothetical protein
MNEIKNSDDIVSRNKAIEKKRIVDQLREMPIVEVACRRAGVARATYYRWLKKDAEFAKLCHEALEHSTSAVSDIAEAKLISAIQEGNMTAISFWLRNHHNSYRTRIDVQGTIRHEAAILTDEQSRLIERALRYANLIEANEGDNDNESN